MRNTLRTNSPTSPGLFSLWSAVVLAGLSPLSVWAQICSSCDRAIGERIYFMRDKVDDAERPLCGDCVALKSRCYLCSLPVKKDFMELADGRFLCRRDSRTVVLNEDTAKQIVVETRVELARAFSRFLTFPDGNVAFTIEDRVHMEELFQTPGFERQCPSVLGYVRSRPAGRGVMKHSISLLSGLPRGRLMSVVAHELAHTWVEENVSTVRAVGRDAVEGVCELIAFKLMEQLGDEREIKYIKTNGYTRGQGELLIEAERTYGFYTILQWIQYGLDPELSREDPDRIRRIDARRAQPVSNVAWKPAPAPALTPVPDTLTLVGLSGTGKGRLALINDRTFSEGESGKVRVGDGSVTLRCLEIREGSVLVQVAGADDKQELPLRGK
jgi:hypothetical protein